MCVCICECLKIKNKQTTAIKNQPDETLMKEDREQMNFLSKSHECILGDYHDILLSKPFHV